MSLKSGRLADRGAVCPVSGADGWAGVIILCSSCWATIKNGYVDFLKLRVKVAICYYLMRKDYVTIAEAAMTARVSLVVAAFGCLSTQAWR